MSYIVSRKTKDGTTELLMDTATLANPTEFASWDTAKPWWFPMQFETVNLAGSYYRRYKEREPDYEYEIREYLK